MKDVIIVFAFTAAILAVIFGGSYFIAANTRERNADCRKRCHPYAYETWGSNDCVCVKTKEFAP